MFQSQFDGGNKIVSLLFILLVGKIKDPKKSLENIVCLKDNATSGFKLKKNIYMDI